MQSSREEIDWQRYYRKDSIFDHPTEYEFYKILRDEILGTRFVAMVQIPLATLLGVRQRKKAGWQSLFARIVQKRVDFLICEIGDLKPRLVIELDGSTHVMKKRIERDEFLESVLAAANIPLLRVPLQGQYNRKAITFEIAEKLGLVKRG